MGRRITKLRQVMDWSAAVWAGVTSGIIFFLLNAILSALYAGSFWVPVRLMASILMGQAVLPPPATFDPVVLIVAIITLMVLSIAFACLIAGILHRWGFIIGIFGGAIIGLGVYTINFYAISYFFPWFFPMRNWIMLLGYVVFGALAGGIYELLEVEEYEQVESKK